MLTLNSSVQCRKKDFNCNRDFSTGHALQHLNTINHFTSILKQFQLLSGTCHIQVDLPLLMVPRDPWSTFRGCNLHLAPCKALLTLTPRQPAHRFCPTKNLSWVIVAKGLHPLLFVLTKLFTVLFAFCKLTNQIPFDISTANHIW